MNGDGLTRLDLSVSLGPFVLLAIEGSLRGLAAIVLLLGALGGLRIAPATFGVDSRDGPDW